MRAHTHHTHTDAATAIDTTRNTVTHRQTDTDKTREGKGPNRWTQTYAHPDTHKTRRHIYTAARLCEYLERFLGEESLVSGDDDVWVCEEVG